MSIITTEEAEQLATVHDWTAEDEQTSTGLRAGAKMTAAALRSLAAERDALMAEAERLKAGGCARDRGLVMHLDAGDAASYPGSGTAWTDLSGKGTTQFCAERDALRAENARLREALEKLLSYAERNECHHENTHRGGIIWTICDDCGGKWADDQGGLKPYCEPSEITNARAVLGETQ